MLRLVIDDEIGEIDLKEARKELGVSQQRMSDLIGCSVSAIATYEQKRTAIPLPIKRLIRFLLAEHRRAA